MTSVMPNITMDKDCSSPTLGKSMKRNNKPLMEKRRRERINVSLNQLKSLVLDALKKDTSQYSKLEKADILEMTVKHLRALQRQHLAVAAATDNSVVNKFHAGFGECATEVSRYLTSVDGLSQDVRGRLMQHLSGVMHRNNAPMTSTASQPQQQQPTATATQPIHIQIPVSSTPATSLPGATIQTLMNCSTGPALQVATSTAMPSVQQQQSLRISPVQFQQQQQQGNSQQPSHQQIQAYVTGAFKVIPQSALTSQSPMTSEVAFVLPSSYIQQTATSYSGSVSSYTCSSPSSSPRSHCSSASSSPEPQYPSSQPNSPMDANNNSAYMPNKNIAPAVPAPVMRESQCYNTVNAFHAQQMPYDLSSRGGVAVKHALKEERVWRPW